MGEHERFSIEEATTTEAGRIRGVILDTIALRVGQVPDLHPRLLEGIEVAARLLAAPSAPDPTAGERMCDCHNPPQRLRSHDDYPATPDADDESAPDPTAGERRVHKPGCGIEFTWAPGDCTCPATPPADDAGTEAGMGKACPTCGICPCPAAFGYHRRMAECPADDAGTEASEPLTEAERASIYATVRGYDEDQHPGPIYAAVEHIKAAAATEARAEAWHEGYASALSKPEIDKVRAKVLTDAADEWHGFGAGRGVMFNRDRLDLTPQQRVEKWLRDRAARIARDGGR